MEPSLTEFQASLLNENEDMTVPRCSRGGGFIIDVKKSITRGHLEGSRLNWTMRGEMKGSKRGEERSPRAKREHIGIN